MATVAPPARDDISGTAPNPSNAVARSAFGVLHDYLLNLLGSAGTPAAARTALGSTAVGDAVFVAASTAAAQSAIGIKQQQSIDYTLSGNALTLKLNPTNLDFRSTTLTSGTPVSVANAAQITTTISSGSTGGTVSGVQSDIAVIAINNAGTMELAWKNLAGGESLDETGLITTVAEGGAGAADSATVFYSTTARTSVAYRVVGIFRSTQTTAGTWAQAPTLVQGIGGQALASMSSIGYGQKWTDVTGSRATGTTYYNTTGKAISVSIYWTDAAYTQGNITVNGVQADISTNSAAGVFGSARCIVPAGMSYSFNRAASSWLELR